MYLRIGLPILMVAISIGIYIFDPDSTLEIGTGITATIIMLGFAIIFTSSKLITRVDPEKVSIRRRFSIYAKIPLAEISKVEARSYKDASKEYGAYALWMSLPFFYIGDMGVVIHCHEKNPTFVSSERTPELVAAINSARENLEQSKYGATQY